MVCAPAGTQLRVKPDDWIAVVHSAGHYRDPSAARGDARKVDEDPPPGEAWLIAAIVFCAMASVICVAVVVLST